MEGRRLVLNDGTTIENGEAGLFNNHLWLYITGMTLSAVAGLFFDPSKTARIVFQYGDMEDVYTGYVNCTDLSINNDGRVSVCMEKGGS